MSRAEKFSELNEDRNSSCSNTFARQWFTLGAAGLLLGAVGRFAIIEYGVLEEVSLGLLAFFVLYTLILFIIFWSFGKESTGQRATSWRPNGLTRFRNYLTFLPITHIIQHGDVKESLRAGETMKFHSEKLNENELSLKINIQKDLVIQAILDEYIAPWYTKISSNTVFLEQSREILHSVFKQFGQKIGQVDRNELAKEAVQTIHLHWKEYCDAVDKVASTGENILKCFKFVHPYLQDTVEVSHRYEQMVCQLLQELIIPDVQSTLLCQFLSGILVKSFFLYYADFICQPSWINYNLITLFSSGSILSELAGGSSQNSSAPPTPLPERSPKTVSEENGFTLPTPTPSDSSASSFTSPRKIHIEKTEDIDQRYFFGKEVQEMLYAEDEVEQFNESPLDKKNRPSPSGSVSSALGGVIPTTALPLLPAGSYSLDHGPNFGFLMQKMDSPTLKVRQKKTSPTSKSLPKPTTGTIEDPHQHQNSIITDSSNFLVIKECSSEKKTSQGNSSASSECNDSSSFNKTPSPTHYYSFDEASRRKYNHPLLVDSGTLSVDGALDAAKRHASSNTHELKLKSSDHELNLKPSRSPVYEEPEDFATSIAKLRSLLEQRDSKKSLNSLGVDEDQSHPDLDLSSCTFSDLDKFSQDHINLLSININDSNSKEERTILNNSIQQSIEDLSKNSVLRQISANSTDGLAPELKCFFFNIAIPKVESCSDSSGQYDFYCIQYEGVYFDEKYDETTPKVILRTTTVKRRFKEFVLLQSKLEEHSQWKPHLKGIKAPNRWLNLSFSKADATTARRAMLERYICEICYHPVLGTGREVLQFMAYGDDGFSPDPMDIHDPKHLLSDKLDKLAKKFTGVINSLKDALPSFESNPPSPHSEVGTPGDLKSHCVPSFQFNEKRLSPDEMEGLTQTPSVLDPKWLENIVPKLNDACETQRSDVVRNIFGGNDSSQMDLQDIVEEGASNSAYPLAAALTQLLCDVLWLPNCRPHNASVSTFMSISGKSLENYVQETIDVFLCDEAVLGYLEWLAKSLKIPEDASQELQYDSVNEVDLKNCLRRRIPAWVRWMWGRNRLDLTIERITGLFQNPIINHDLVLSVSELLFSRMVQSEMLETTE